MEGRRRAVSRQRRSLVVPIGGMHGFDDDAGANRESTRLARNVVFREGAVKMRWPLDSPNQNTVSGTAYGGGKSDTKSNRLFLRYPFLSTGDTWLQANTYASAGTNQLYIVSQPGSGLATGTSYNIGLDDQRRFRPLGGFVDRLGAFFTVYGNHATNGYSAKTALVPADGGGLITDYARPNIGANSICTLGNRLVWGGYAAKGANSDTANWYNWANSSTKSNATVTLVTGLDLFGRTRMYSLQYSTTAGYIEYTIVDGASITDEGYWTLHVDFINTYFDYDFPLTLEIEDGSGNEIASKEFYVPNRTDNPGLYREFVNFYHTGSTVLVRLKAGTTALAVDTAKTIYVGSDQNSQNIGLHIVKGDYVFGSDVESATNGDLSEAYPTRILFSEIDEFTRVRSENYVNIASTPGAVRLVRPFGKNTLIVGKTDGLFIYQLTADPDRPFVPVDSIIGIDVFGGHSWAEIDGMFFFAGSTGVHAISPNGELNNLVKNDRVNLLDDMTLNDYTGVWIDPLNREVYVGTTDGKTWVYALDYGWWSYHDTGRGSNLVMCGGAYVDSTTSTTTGLWMLGDDEGDSAMAAYRVKESIDEDRLARYIGGAGSWQDFDVTTQFDLHTIESPPPYQEITVEDVELVHTITESQAANTVKFSFTRDGSTFTDEVTVTVSPLSSGGDGQPMRLPIWETARRIGIRITAEGKGGVNTFNFNRATANVLMRGRWIQETNASTV